MKNNEIVIVQGAIQQAINAFAKQAAFLEALQSISGRPVTSSHVANWMQRGKVPPEFAPEIELLTGVPCERLCPVVNWTAIRGRALTKHGTKTERAAQLPVAAVGDGA